MNESSLLQISLLLKGKTIPMNNIKSRKITGSSKDFVSKDGLAVLLAWGL